MKNNKSNVDKTQLLKRLAEAESKIVSAGPTRARSFNTIATEELFRVSDCKAATFAEYCLNRWGIRSDSHRARLVSFGRFLARSDELISPPGKFDDFVTEWGYRPLDALNVDQKDEAIIRINNMMDSGGWRAFTGPHGEQLVYELLADPKQPVSHGIGEAPLPTPVLPDERFCPTPRELDVLLNQHGKSLSAAASQLQKGINELDAQAFVFGLLKIADVCPEALSLLFRCKQRHRVQSMAHAFVSVSTADIFVPKVA
jgi:hypothetical protein